MRLLLLASLMIAATAARAEKPDDAITIRAEPAAAFDAFVAAHHAGLPKGGGEALAAFARHASALDAECGRGGELACALLPDIYAEASRLARADRKTALALLDKACKDGDQIHCALAGEALDDPGGTSTETPQAIDRLVAACKKGSTQACNRAAIIRLGAGIAHPALSETEARGHVERACASGYPTACSFLAAQVGAYYAGKYAEAPNLAADTRACRLGLWSACRTIVESIAPQAPFGCSLCKDDKLAASGDFDDRCQSCSIAACQREKCCPTCKERTTAACCDGEDTHHYPQVAPRLDPAVVERAVETARRTTARGRTIFQAGCQRGLKEWCKDVADLDAGIAALGKPGK